MTLGGYNGSTNDCARVSGALPDDTNEASDKGVCEGCVVVGNSPQESPYIFMAMHLWEAAEPTNTRAATRAKTTQPRFAQPHSSPRPTFSTAYRLLAGTQRAAQPTRREQPPTARAPAMASTQTTICQPPDSQTAESGRATASKGRDRSGGQEGEQTKVQRWWFTCVGTSLAVSRSES